MHFVLRQLNAEATGTLEKLAALFHDCPVIWEIVSPEEISVVIKRPYFERANLEERWGIFPAWRMPLVKTHIKLTGFKDFVKCEGDIMSKKDWFLTFSFDTKDNNLSIEGAINKYRVIVSADTVLEINDEIPESDIRVWKKDKEVEGVRQLLNNLR